MTEKKTPGTWWLRSDSHRLIWFYVGLDAEGAELFHNVDGDARYGVVSHEIPDCTGFDHEFGTPPVPSHPLTFMIRGTDWIELLKVLEEAQEPSVKFHPPTTFAEAAQESSEKTHASISQAIWLMLAERNLESVQEAHAHVRIFATQPGDDPRTGVAND